ncbi:MAG: phage holin family protein [Ferruginibacter sp.]
MTPSAVLHKSENNHSGSSGNKNIIMDTRPDDSIQSLIDRAKDYVETRIDLLKLQAANKTADVISSIASAVVMGVMFIFFFLLLNIGLALLLGQLLGNNYYGFFIMAAIYLIIGLLFKSSGDKWVKQPVSTSLIKKLFK